MSVLAEAPKLEAIEWSDVWVMDADRTEHPRVLLVGDSIVKGYYSVVEGALAGRASLARYATSLFLTNPDYLAELRLLLGRYHFDVIHINNGLHGADYSEEEYRSGLVELVNLLKQEAPQARLIWCMSTPVRQKGKLSVFAEMNQRVLERNRIAGEIMAQEEIPVDDLYAAVQDHPEYFGDDGVHHNREGQAALAAQVAKAIGEHLAKE